MTQDITSSAKSAPCVVVFAFASCFGCQLQITNAEKYLVDVLGQIDLQYWQLISGEPLPQEFDVAVIEGAITTEEARAMVEEIRARAAVVITIGSCANTGGIPGIARENVNDQACRVYGEKLPEACGEILAPYAVTTAIPVEFQVSCCPIDPYAFIDILHRVLYGSNKSNSTTTMCGQCKVNGKQCLYEQGEMCMGLVTRDGCGARCPKLGRACNGCAGLSPDANLASAYDVVDSYGLDVDLFKQRLGMFNAPSLSQAAE